MFVDDESTILTRRNITAKRINWYDFVVNGSSHRKLEIFFFLFKNQTDDSSRRCRGKYFERRNFVMEEKKKKRVKRPSWILYKL